MRWLALVRPGDWLAAALGAALCVATVPFARSLGIAEKAVVRRGGEVYAELDLANDRRIDVAGPLGTTTIAVDRRRVRVVSDPGAHQYCVHQGWLERAGEIAICAPNQVSVEISGGEAAYDSLNY
jgi:hypothetical protein